MDKEAQRAQHNREQGITQERKHNKINMWCIMLERSKRIWETTTRRMANTTCEKEEKNINNKITAKDGGVYN